MRSALVAAVTCVLAAGCVRAGFPESGSGIESSADAEVLPVREAAIDGERDVTSPDDLAPTGTARATSRNDNCDTALDVDLSPLAQGAELLLTIDTRGARLDYKHPSCGGLLDVVVALRGVARAMMRCTGGGNIVIWHSGAGRCGTEARSVHAMTCSGNSTSITLRTGRTTKVIFCRKPDEGPATVRLFSQGG